MTNQLDVIVVGGGLAGLTAAATAAREGARVALLDARSLGGRARTADRDGFLLNEGAHALYRSAGGRAVLDGLGVRVTGAPPPLSSYHAVWDGEVVPFPVAPKALLGSRLLGARSKAKLAGWFAGIGRHAERAADRSIDEWLDDEQARPELRKYVLTVLRLSTYSARPERGPARYLLPQLDAGGVLYLDGGWQTIVDELVRVSRSAAVTIHTHQPVTALQRTTAAWTVVAPALELTARCVVLAAGGPAFAADLLGSDDAGWVERAGPRQRAACLDVGGSAGWVPFLISADAPLYLSQHAPVAALAPEGQSLYTAMRYLGDDDELTAAENRTALERHLARAGGPAPGERAVERFLAAPVVSWGSPQVGIERPTGLELAASGIYAAGDWVGTRLLADASILSGAAAGRAAARATVSM